MIVFFNKDIYVCETIPTWNLKIYQYKGAFVNYS